ncbi:hypothetical protein GCM10025734_39960 [Kitasatospora paranensis]
MAGRGLLALTDDLLDLLPDRLERDPEALQGLGGDTFTLVDQAQEDVLGADVVVVEHPGFFLSQDDNPPRAVGEPFEHRFRSSERSASSGSVPALSFRMLVPLSGAAHGQAPLAWGLHAARPADTNPNLMLGVGVPTGGPDAPDIRYANGEQAPDAGGPAARTARSESCDPAHLHSYPVSRGDSRSFRGGAVRLARSRPGSPVGAARMTAGQTVPPVGPADTAGRAGPRDHSASSSVAQPMGVPLPVIGPADHAPAMSMAVRNGRPGPPVVVRRRVPCRTRP